MALRLTLQKEKEIREGIASRFTYFDRFWGKRAIIDLLDEVDCLRKELETLKQGYQFPLDASQDGIVTL